MKMTKSFVLIFWGVLLILPESVSSQPAPTPNLIRVAAISFEPKKLDLQANIESLEKAFREAKAGNARIAVAPEGALEGYIINEILSGSIPLNAIRQVALSIDSQPIRQFQALAKELDLCLVFGFAELIDHEIFNTAIFIDNQGAICGKYHKMQFAEGYHPDWWFNRLGDQSRTFETPYGRCGILICNDRWNPALAKIQALDGAQFLVIPAFGSTSRTQDQAVLSRGRENQIPIIEANVGVGLIVNNGKIETVQRKRDGITFGSIEIPTNTTRDKVARDLAETEFLKWRQNEMKQRFNAKTYKIVEE